MTIYKAVRNFLTVFVVLAVAAGALCIGGGVYYGVQSAASSQALSKLGSTGAEVTRVQKKLKELGYYSGAADGIYGNATKAAVKAFQKNCGITADGVAGPKTLLYLGLGGSSGGNSTGYSDADVELLAKVISAEARGESYEGQRRGVPKRGILLRQRLQLVRPGGRQRQASRHGCPQRLGPLRRCGVLFQCVQNLGQVYALPTGDQGDRQS